MNLFRVPADMPLYDILNEFQKGSSHMAAVVRLKGKNKKPPSVLEEEKSDGSTVAGGNPHMILRMPEIIGIITLEDVFEELLQEEIVDETDEYVDVHKRIHVAAAAAASSVARAPSTRRLTAQKGAECKARKDETRRSLKQDISISRRTQGVSRASSWEQR
ncbi:hypothetical protein HAX54_048850 [Datura stramonium]|uniref:DUF21 domain-containing protein n=1 Tax=Datura stramonium TaxID=4076 RepID=A0ABS8SUZ1_DATST|nr:hypothetical protein [Datura stramonium]